MFFNEDSSIKPDSIKHFPFSKAIEKMPYSNLLLKEIKAKYSYVDLNISFTKAIRQHWGLVIRFQEIGKFQLLVIQKTSHSCYNLLFDGRHVTNIKPYWTSKTWLLDRKGNLKKEKKGSNILPTLHNIPKDSVPLSTLLNLEITEPDPQTYSELVCFLQKHKKEATVYFLIAPPKSKLLWYKNNSDLTPKYLMAFTKQDNSIGYKEIILNIENNPKPELQIPFQPEKNQHNRSAAVNVKLFGLNEAYNLGCITLQELHLLSKQLSSTFGCVFLELDNKNQAKFATYRDVLCVVHFELSNNKAWEKFLNFIYTKKTLWAEEKQKILYPLCQILDKYSNTISSPFTKCYNQIKSCINNFKIVVFSKDDSQIHAIKLQLAHYFNLKYPKKHCSLSLTNDAQNNLTVIKNSDITVFNLSAYLSESVLFSDVLPPAVLQSTVTSLKNYKNKQSTGLSTRQHCKTRGEQASQCILTSWQNVGLDFLTMFDFDIFSMHILSLSYLSFQTVWTKYTRLGGTYHHGLEKTKPFYEKMLRDHSHGGYFYSCQDKLDAGQPLHGSFGNPASSILELDIISSYGYAASNMTTPSGFCYGYIANDEGVLVRCDKTQRHKTFEFLSVFYTLHILEQQGYLIQTVYSNFHQFGIFSIGNYPIDLVVICQNNILLYQFDGQVYFICI